MVNGGYGETHVNTLLAALNIPCVSQKTEEQREGGWTTTWRNGRRNMPKKSARGNKIVIYY